MRWSAETAFFLSGAVFMTLLASLKYAVQSEIGLVGLLVAFAFGGVVGLLAVSKEDSFLKNTVFIGAFAWLLWAFLSPVQTVGNNWVVNQTELLAIITVVVIFLEQDFLNMIRKMTNRKQGFRIGFFGILMLTIFLSVSGLSQRFFEWMSQNTMTLLVLFLAWLTFLYVISNRGLKGIKRLFGSLTKRLEGGK